MRKFLLTIATAAAALGGVAIAAPASAQYHRDGYYHHDGNRAWREHHERALALHRDQREWWRGHHERELALHQQQREWWRGHHRRALEQQRWEDRHYHRY